MSCKALIVGYGSAGRRHSEILSEFSEIDEIGIVSSQKGLPFKSFSSLEQAVEYKPDYVIIASETYKHEDHLKYIIGNFSAEKILVEKPLFKEYSIINPKDKDIFTGYNLRFHPHIQSLRKLIEKQKIRAVYCSCHTFLPEWRTNNSYTDSYSSSRERGGGVMLDLSHEIDFLIWLFGYLEIDFVKYGNFSNLLIDSEDSLFLSGHLKNNVPLELSLSYFSLLPKRELHVVTDEISISVDLVSNSLKYRKKGLNQVTDILDSFDINVTYILQHKDILSKRSSFVCTYSEGLQVNKFIDQLKSWT